MRCVRTTRHGAIARDLDWNSTTLPYELLRSYGREWVRIETVQPASRRRGRPEIPPDLSATHALPDTAQRVVRLRGHNHCLRSVADVARCRIARRNTRPSRRRPFRSWNETAATGEIQGSTELRALTSRKRSNLPSNGWIATARPATIAASMASANVADDLEREIILGRLREAGKRHGERPSVRRA